jgi:hypothetical protein
VITLMLLGSLAGHLWTGYLIPTFWVAALVGSYAVLAAASLASTLRGVAVPIRLLISLYKLLTGITRAVVSVLFSNRLWETVRAAALGTSGAPFATIGLAVSRGQEEQPLLGWPLFYEELPADIVASIIARRDRHASERIQRVLGSVDDPEALADAIKALKEIATNTTFVHAAYYTAPAVIKLVAQWIAAPPLERLREKGYIIRSSSSEDVHP